MYSAIKIVYLPCSSILNILHFSYSEAWQAPYEKIGQMILKVALSELS